MRKSWLWQITFIPNAFADYNFCGIHLTQIRGHRHPTEHSNKRKVADLIMGPTARYLGTPLFADMLNQATEATTVLPSVHDTLLHVTIILSYVASGVLRR